MERESIGIGHSKCLALGGYLVLDHSNTCLVVSLSPKISCKAKLINDSKCQVIVDILPQNKNFVFNPSDFQQFNPDQAIFEKFLLTTLKVFFSVYSLPQGSIYLVIESDEAFYNSCGKTGLGSSSASTVAIVSALISLLHPYVENIEEQIFKLSSISHNTAQGKVGSCFDISCAVWGTQIYRRPSQSLLSLEHINIIWDNEHTHFQIPSHLNLLLLSTPFAGSSTPSLVRQFLVQAENDKETYNNLKRCVEVASQALISGNENDIKDTFLKVRETLRYITINWKVNVVPDEINEIANKVELIPGVITSLIPGAGGFDSIAIIVKKNQNIDLQELGLSIIADAE